MHIRGDLLGYGALGFVMAAAFAACAADQGDGTKSLSQQATTGTSGANVLDATSGTSGDTAGASGSASGAAGDNSGAAC